MQYGYLQQLALDSLVAEPRMFHLWLLHAQKHKYKRVF